jgi:hydrogenase-4 component F
VALVLLLRLRGVLDGNAAAGGSAMRPGPLLIAFGLISLLVAAFSLWRRRDTKRFFALSTIGQNGVAAYAFGLGGTAATFAGLLHLTVHTLARTAVFPCIGHRARHRALALTLAAGMIAAAGLPPFGVFSSTFLVISQTLSHAPLLVLPLALGLVVGGWALIARLQALCFGPPRDQTAAPGMLALAPSWLHLGVSVMLGLAMPAAVFGWMWRIAAGVP